MEEERYGHGGGGGGDGPHQGEDAGRNGGGGGEAEHARPLRPHATRNKRRAAEFDPALLARHLTSSAMTAAPLDDPPSPLQADHAWLTFPDVPAHPPHPQPSSSSSTSTTTTTTVASVEAQATRAQMASRRYSIAAGVPARDALHTLRNTPLPPLPHQHAHLASAPPSPQLSSSLSSTWADVQRPPLSGLAVGSSSGPKASADPHDAPHRSLAPHEKAPAGRKESKGEADYQRLRELAFSEDLKDLERQQALFLGGKDNLGRQVVVFALYKLGDKVDFERLLLYIIKVMDKIVEQDYTLVFCQTHMTAAHRPPFAWLRKAYGMFQRKYKKNLKAAYIIHASTFVRMTLKLFKPFISNKFWKKLVYIDEVTDIYKYVRPDQLTLPDEVLSFRRETRASPLFGLPLAAGCARDPSAAGLPIICERAFEVLDVRAVELEGIFRVSGSTALLNELKQRFDRGEDVDLSFADIHTVAGLLKLYLRELPEPLLTFRLYEPFIAAVRQSREWSDIRDEVSRLIQELPPENYILSARLFLLLGRVAESSDKNLMTANNLAIVIGPNVMRAPPGAPPERLITDAGAINSLVRFLIQHSTSLFPSDSVPL